MIKELLIAGRSPKEIATLLNTSIDYVYKEKGKLRRDGLMVTDRSLTIAAGSSDQTLAKESADIGGHPVTDRLKGLGEFDLPPLGKADLMSMYDSFEKNLSPSEVIIKLGIRPDICQNEHGRFLAMKSRDPFELQGKIVLGLQGAPNEIQLIINKSHRGFLLTNEELMSVINYRSQIFANQYVKDAISSPFTGIPVGLERFVCSECHQAQPGVIFDKDTYAGSNLQIPAKIHVCLNCKNKAKRT
jgi:hypothetical protein